MVESNLSFLWQNQSAQFLFFFKHTHLVTKYPMEISFKTNYASAFNSQPTSIKIPYLQHNITETS